MLDNETDVMLWLSSSLMCLVIVHEYIGAAGVILQHGSPFCPGGTIEHMEISQDRIN